MPFKTVAVIIPNEEFLVKETSASLDLRCITESLTNIGYTVKKISILEETEKAVAAELKVLSKLYDILIILSKSNPKCVSYALIKITTGEFEKAPLIQNGEGISWPKSLKIIKSEEGLFPILYFQRIFILELDIVKQQLQILERHLKQYRLDEIYSKMFYFTKYGVQTKLESFSIDSVTFHFEQNGSRDLITLTSNNFDKIVNAEVILKDKFSDNVKNGFWVNHWTNAIYECTDNHIKLSIEVIEKCFIKYGLENIFLSFNGGKDCTVLLHLVQTVIEKLYKGEQKHTKMFCLYVRSENAFKEQDEFINQCKIYLNLEVITVSTSIKEALRIVLSEHPNFKACFMGTRRTDPYSSHLNVFEITDPEWPQVMRCNPLLDWNYTDIWDYLLYYKVPYCKLYDYGYTSLGNTINTIRNPSLIYTDGGKKLYLPAYKMMVDKKERSGRNFSKI